jgi:hypothetical protein
MYKNIPKTKFVGNVMVYNFCNNSKCHLEQRKRGIYKKPIFATFDLQYLDSCTRVHEPFEPTYKMSKQRFIQVCGLLSFILRFTPFFTLYFEGYANIFVCVISRRTSNTTMYYVLRRLFYFLKTVRLTSDYSSRSSAAGVKSRG